CVRGKPESKAAAISTSSETLDRLDRTTVLARLDGDVELLTEVAEMLAEQAPALLTALRSAVTTADLPSIERAAHSLKSCLRQVGADGTAATAQQIESSAARGEVGEPAALLALLEQQVTHVVTKLPELARGEAA